MADADLAYLTPDISTAPRAELDHKAFARNQIRTVLVFETLRDRVFTETISGGTEVPKWSSSRVDIGGLDFVVRESDYPWSRIGLDVRHVAIRDGV